MLITKDLIALKDDKEGVLSEICLAVTGIWQGHAGGTFSIDAADIEKMKLNFDKRSLDIVIDYEHQTLSGGDSACRGLDKRAFYKRRRALRARKLDGQSKRIYQKRRI